MKPSKAQGASANRKGVVVTTIISVLSVVGVLIVAWLGHRSSKGQELVQLEHAVVAEGIGETAINLAAARVWGGYQRAYDQELRSDENLKAYLDSLGLQDGAGTDLLDSLGVNQDHNGDYPLGGGFVVRLVVIRTDSAGACELTFEALASMGEGAPEHRSRRIYDGVSLQKEE